MSQRDRVLAAVTAAAGVAGVGISMYLTVVHYSALPLVCSTTGLINCERVLSSPYSVIAGSPVPTSAAGIVWFVVSAVLGAAQLAGRNQGAPPFTGGGKGGRLQFRLLRLQLAWSAIGLVTVLGLLFVEIVELGAICIWCTTAHALVVLSFLVTLVRWQSREGVGAGE